MVGRVGLEAEHVVGSVDGAVAYHHSVAVYDVYAVVVPVRLAVYGDALDQQVAALVVGLVPAGGVAQGDAFDYHVVALTEIDVLRTVRLIRTAQFQWIFVDTPLDIVHHIVGCSKTTPVNRPFPRYTNILLLNCENHRHPTNIRIFFVIPRIGRSQ